MFTRALLAASAALLVAAPASGFGLRSHLWIAQQVFDDLADCSLGIRGQTFAVPAESCRAIRAHRGAFMAGAIGPDAFPDLVIGQSIVHPGVEGGYQASDWLDRLLRSAETDEEIAFAWGYAMHYAGDSFAHSYVNNYAGADFDLWDGRPNVELRHFRLEKYIDQKLPFAFDAAELDVPESFLAKQLVMFDYLANGDSPPAASAHLSPVLTSLRLARAAEKRAPGIAEEAEREAARQLEALRAVEADLGLSDSAGLPLDRRAEAIRRLSRPDRRRLTFAHDLYRDAAIKVREHRGLVAFTKAWAADIERIAEHYIAASLDVSQSMARQAVGQQPAYGEPGLMQPYRNWYSCYAPTLLGDPAAAGEALCDRLKDIGGSLDFTDAALRATLGVRAKSIYLMLSQAERQVKVLARRAVIKFTSLADPSTSKLIREIVDPASVDHASLNVAFQDSPNGQLPFLCAADWVDADLGLRSPLASGQNKPCDGAPRMAEMDPHKFKPLEYALVLAKVSLLDGDGVGTLAQRFGGDPAELKLTPHPRYSVMLDTVRSLDGSQPWQTQSLPPPREKGYEKIPPLTSAGHGHVDSDPRQFPFYRTLGLRQGPFAVLFPEPFEGSILMRAEMRPPKYPFVPCPGDPLRAAGGSITVGRC